LTGIPVLGFYCHLTGLLLSAWGDLVDIAGIGAVVINDWAVGFNGTDDELELLVVRGNTEELLWVGGTLVRAS
jgi:hypothetical protein